jgi:hypothetical protein
LNLKIQQESEVEEPPEDQDSPEQLQEDGVRDEEWGSPIDDIFKRVKGSINLGKDEDIPNLTWLGPKKVHLR